jgi:LysM repeat protein
LEEKMFWRGLGIAGFVLAGLGAVGCFNSEADFKALREENDILSAELGEVRKENEILSRALDDIRREQETLQLLLNAGKSSLNAGRLNPPSVAQAVGGSQVSGGGGWEEEWQTPQSPASVPALPAPPARVASPSTPVPATAPAQGGRTYVTKDGDVLSTIARANNTTVAAILELNPNLRNRRNHMIYTNERLRLP